MTSQSGARYPVIAAHVRKEESTTVISIRSPEPTRIILWMAQVIRYLGYEVLLDHDYSEEADDDKAPDQVSRPPGRPD